MVDWKLKGEYAGKAKVNALRKTIAQVDLSKYRENLRSLRAAMGEGVKLMAVVKANAYGHGLVHIAQAAQDERVDYLAVALAEEGAQLREAGIDLPILVLAGLSPDSTLEAVAHGLTLTVHTPDHVAHARQAAERLGKQAQAHIKLDTGMNRIGVKDSTELRDLLALLGTIPTVALTGAFTHFASADDPNPGMTDRQLARFQEFAQLLPGKLLLHASGSSALIKRADARLNMVRAGISTYGYSPVPTEIPLKPVLSWLAEITHVKQIAPGETVSYGATFTAQRATRVATLAVGYGDGYSRLLSNTGEVLINRTRCKVLGRVCMDQVMVDVTDAGSVEIGSQAILIGSDGAQAIGADELARKIGTIPYEILLSISSRVPRVYSR